MYVTIWCICLLDCTSIYSIQSIHIWLHCFGMAWNSPRSSTCELRWLRPAELLKSKSQDQLRSEATSTFASGSNFLARSIFLGVEMMRRGWDMLRRLPTVQCLELSTWMQCDAKRLTLQTCNRCLDRLLLSRLELIGFLGEIDPDNSRVPNTQGGSALKLRLRRLRLATRGFILVW